MPAERRNSGRGYNEGITAELLIIFLLILANGVFAMSEIAVVAARKVRLQQRADEGDERAKAALALAHDPNKFLSTVQFGITMVGVLANQALFYLVSGTPPVRMGNAHASVVPYQIGRAHV